LLIRALIAVNFIGLCRMFQAVAWGGIGNPMAIFFSSSVLWRAIWPFVDPCPHCGQFYRALPDVSSGCLGVGWGSGAQNEGVLMP
jgi:hypothetical protein